MLGEFAKYDSIDLLHKPFTLEEIQGIIFNLLQTYDQKAEKKIVQKLTWSILIFVYILATIVINDVSKADILRGLIAPFANELHNNLIPYAYLVDLYPSAVNLGLRSFISTTPYPLYSPQFSDFVWMNTVIVFGILCFLPRLCFIIGAPARMSYFDYELYFHQQYKHYYLMSGVITAIFAFLTLSLILELCFLIFLITIIVVAFRLLNGLKK